MQGMTGRKGRERQAEGGGKLPRAAASTSYLVHHPPIWETNGVYEEPDDVIHAHAVLLNSMRGPVVCEVMEQHGRFVGPHPLAKHSGIEAS